VEEVVGSNPVTPTQPYLLRYGFFITIKKASVKAADAL